MARYTVQAPDGKTITIEGPEGAAEADIFAQAQQLYQPQQAAPKQDPSLLQDVARFGRGAVQGAVVDPLVGLTQLGAHAIGQGEAGDKLAQWSERNYQDTRAKLGGEDTDVSRGVGSVLGAFVPGLGVLGKGVGALRGAASGALQAIAQPVTNPEQNYAEAKGQQAALGGIAGGLGGKLTGMLAPKGKLGEELARRNAGTLGQQTGSKLITALEDAGSQNYAGSILRRSQERGSGVAKNLSDKAYERAFGDPTKGIRGAADLDLTNKAVQNRFVNVTQKLDNLIADRNLYHSPQEQETLNQIAKNLYSHATSGSFPAHEYKNFLKGLDALKEKAYKEQNVPFGETLKGIIKDAETLGGGTFQKRLREAKDLYPERLRIQKGESKAPTSNQALQALSLYELANEPLLWGAYQGARGLGTAIGANPNAVRGAAAGLTGATRGAIAGGLRSTHEEPRGYAGGKKVLKGAADFLFKPRDTKAMKASEALGQHEGKYLGLTQTDNFGVHGNRMGGNQFPNFQNISPLHQQAGVVWMMDSPLHAQRMIDQSNKNMIWSTYIGAPDQLKSNKTVAQDVLDQHYQRNLTPEQIALINNRIATMRDNKKNLVFPQAFDIRDKFAAQELGLDTFARRGALADILGAGKGVGQTKGGIAMPNYQDILRSHRDPLTEGVPTSSVGTRLFTVDNTRPTVHTNKYHTDYRDAAFGEDQRVQFPPIPQNIAVRDWYNKMNAKSPGNTHGNAWFSYMKEPQLISEDYLTNMQRHGFDKGGKVPGFANEGFVGYPHLMRQGAKMRDAAKDRKAETLPDPRTYGFVQGFLGSEPDEVGSVLDKNYGPMKEGAYWGGQTSNALDIIPALFGAAKGVKGALSMLGPKNVEGKVADKYMRGAGLGRFDASKGMAAPSDAARQEWIGKAHEAGARAFEQNDPAYKAAVFNSLRTAYPDLIKQTGAQNYDQLMKASYAQAAKETAAQAKAIPHKMEFWSDPEYTSKDYLYLAKQAGQKPTDFMRQELAAGKPFQVYKDSGNPHPYLAAKNAEGVNQNELFRGVHDYFGHLGPTKPNSFGPKGEENTWVTHSQMYSPLAKPAVTAETRGQNSFVNYVDPENLRLRAEGKPTVNFAKNVPVMLPAEAMDPNYVGGAPKALKGIVPGFAGGKAVKGGLDMIGAIMGKQGFKQKQDPIVAKALDDYLNGRISEEQRIAIVRDRLPIKPLTQLPPAYSDDEIRNSLMSNKQSKALADVPAGMRVGNRLDIPAYEQHGIYVDTTHQNNKPISYNRTGHLKDVQFTSKPNQAARVGLGTKEQALTPMGAEMGSGKAPFALIEGTNIGTHDDEVRRMAEEYLKDPNWAQVGMNPYRHSQFYDKADMKPVWSAEEKLQVGPLILVPKRGLEKTDWTDPRLNLGNFEGKRYGGGGKIGGLAALAKKLLPGAEKLPDRDRNLTKYMEKSAVQMPMYHGTSADISEFRPGQANAIFVSPNPTFSGMFAKQREDELLKKSIRTSNETDIDKLRGALPARQNIMKVHVNAQNPFDYDNPKHIDNLVNELNKSRYEDGSLMGEGLGPTLSKGDWSWLEMQHIQKAIRDMGHDSFWAKEEGVKNLGVYDPRQLKSATGNIGTYDPMNPDIGKRLGGLV